MLLLLLLSFRRQDKRREQEENRNHFCFKSFICLCGVLHLNEREEKRVVGEKMSEFRDEKII